MPQRNVILWNFFDNFLIFFRDVRNEWRAGSQQWKTEVKTLIKLSQKDKVFFISAVSVRSTGGAHRQSCKHCNILLWFFLMQEEGKKVSRGKNQKRQEALQHSAHVLIRLFIRPQRSTKKFFTWHYQKTSSSIPQRLNI